MALLGGHSKAALGPAWTVWVEMVAWLDRWRESLELRRILEAVQVELGPEQMSKWVWRRQQWWGWYLF